MCQYNARNVFNRAMLQLEGKIGIEISIFLKFLFQLSTSRNQKQNFELFRVRIA